MSSFQQLIASGVLGVHGKVAAKLAMKGAAKELELKQLKKQMEEHV